MADLEKIKERCRTYIEEVLNQKRIEKIDEYVRPDFVEHTPPPGGIQGREGVKKTLVEMSKAFPDLQFSVEDIIAEGDKVCIYTTMRGTHEGDFMGIPATHKKVEVQTVDILRIDEDLNAVEHWAVADSLTMMQQLGLVPMPEEQAA